MFSSFMYNMRMSMTRRQLSSRWYVQCLYDIYAFYFALQGICICICNMYININIYIYIIVIFFTYFFGRIKLLCYVYQYFVIIYSTSRRKQTLCCFLLSFSINQRARASR